MTFTRRLPAVCLALAAMPALAGTALGQARDSVAIRQDCARVFAALQPGPPGATCTTLARLLVTRLQTNLRSAPRTPDGPVAPAASAGQAQSRRSDGAVAAGTPGQAEAVPGVQPTGVASASLAAAGTDSGTKTIVAVSINPATLFGGSDQASVGKWSRIGDLTLLVPLSKEKPGPLDIAGLRYLGLRGRINLTGISVGDPLLAELHDAVARFLDQGHTYFERIRAALVALPDSAAIQACADAVSAARLGATPAECGGQLTLDLAADAYQGFLDAAARARDKADARYLGVDLRVDLGDPTLGADPENDVSAFSVGFAYGRRFLRAGVRDVMSQLRTRFAARYAEPRHGGDVLWGVEGGLGLELSRLVQDDQYVRLNAGFEFRHSGGPATERDRLQPNYLSLRGGLTVPMLGGASIVLGLNAPVSGKVSPSLSANVNWGLLLK